ncbi:MAG TPA: hypothetical protein VEC60_08690, partial [Reyranella sp.]|nr:hypothetical protein [Reyranella sp.]
MEDQGRDRLTHPRGLPALCGAALARDPRREAVEFEGRWFAWGDLQKVAAALTEELGAARCPAAPVIFIPRNHPSSIAALLALLAEGRTVRMVYAF